MKTRRQITARRNYQSPGGISAILRGHRLQAGSVSSLSTTITQWAICIPTTQVLCNSNLKIELVLLHYAHYPSTAQGAQNRVSTLVC
jgi:hypothetical protein